MPCFAIGWPPCLVVAAEQVVRVVPQAGEGIDAAGAGADLTLNIVRESVEILLGLGLLPEQGVQVGVLCHDASPRP